MTDNSKTYFSYPDIYGNPHDGLNTSIEVLKTVSMLISCCDDLHNLGDQMNGGLYGLSIIIDSARNGIETASEELAESQKTAVDESNSGIIINGVLDKNTSKETYWQMLQEGKIPIGTKVPVNLSFGIHAKTGGEIDESNSDKTFKQWMNEGEISKLATQQEEEPKKRATAKQLQVREKLIAASYNDGDSITDISQAINLKKTQTGVSR